MFTVKPKAAVSSAPAAKKPEAKKASGLFDDDDDDPLGLNSAKPSKKGTGGGGLFD